MPPIKLRDSAPKRTLDDIFSEPDDLGLLSVKPKASSSGPIELAKFEEINSFFKAHGREPLSSGDLSEKTLSRRLASFRKNKELSQALIPLDRHDLLVDLNNPESDAGFSLSSPQDDRDFEIDESASSLEDILNSDSFSVFDEGDDSIFDLTHVHAVDDRATPDEIAQRKPCNDFRRFEKLFNDVREGIKSKSLKVTRFKQASQISQGDFFILQGVICFIDEVGETRETKNGHFDARLRVIFDNGTESNLLLRSLGKALHLDGTGRRVIPDPSTVEDAFNNVTHKDKLSGQIYFLRSLTNNAQLKAIPNLIKIGFTSGTVEDRVKNAEKDPTFLEAPVKILGAMDCYNLNPNKFETLIHGFLHAQRIQMKLVSMDGSSYQPKEWFSVDFDTAREVARRIIDGTIVNYRMDNTTARIVHK